MTPIVDERALIARIRQLSADSLESAIERGHLLKELNLKWHEYEAKRVGISFQTGYKLIQLVDHERMRRDDWQKPALWTVCHQLLQLPDKIFDDMLKAGFINHNTTRRQVNDFVKMRKAKFRRVIAATKSEPPSIKQIVPKEYNTKFLNLITQGDCFRLIPQLEDESIAAVITSPPYGEQRKDFYNGVPEDQYPAWFCKLMDAIKPKLKPDGNVLVVIRSRPKDGAVSDYVLKTILAVRENGWIQPEELIWYKTDSPPQGAINRPRRAFEHILWFTKSRRPFIDLTACGKPSDRIGCVGKTKKTDRSGRERELANTSVRHQKGKARITDVLKLRIPIMSISHSDLMSIRSERGDAGLS